MPIKRAALRQLRKDRPRAARNQAAHSALRTLKKQWLTLLAQHKFDEAATLFPTVAKRFDQAAAKGLIHKNTAARTKSRLTAQLARRNTRTAPPRPAPTPASGASGRS